MINNIHPCHQYHPQGWRDISNFTRDLQQPFQLYRESEQTYLQVMRMLVMMMMLVRMMMMLIMLQW